MPIVQSERHRQTMRKWRRFTQTTTERAHDLIKIHKPDISSPKRREHLAQSSWIVPPIILSALGKAVQHEYHATRAAGRRNEASNPGLPKYVQHHALDE